MKDYDIEIIRKGEVIPENENGGIFTFYAWPTVGKLKDGTIMVVCSGGRTRHIDPFGKVMAFYSRDNGKNWTRPCVLANTPLDDRDAGFTTLKDGRIMINSVTNSIDYQIGTADYFDRRKEETRLFLAYLNSLNKEKDEEYLGGYYLLSDDGYIFNKGLKKFPLHTPHGGVLDKNGKVYFVGTNYEKGSNNSVQLMTSEDGENWTLVHDFGTKFGKYSLYEPFGYFLDDGTYVVLLRGQNMDEDDFGTKMTVLRTISKDGGKTFSDFEDTKIVGGPTHVVRHSSGKYILSYGYRQEPYADRIMISDDGLNFSGPYDIDRESPKFDHGYPSTIELDDGTLMTVYYQGKDTGFNNNTIKFTIWKFKEKN